MFEAAKTIPFAQLTEVAYYAMRALERRFRPQELETTRLLAGLASEPGQEEQRIASHWLEEIEHREGRTIDQLSDETVKRYLGDFADLVQRRSESQFKPDPERGRQLLEKLGREVPLPVVPQRKAS
ncbi:MAG TPA: hypothetical protein VN783_08520 [Thermoanaerobaculia bacterium]|nr:hypothetical protein [Thermoanaerobaculia bacterium]